MNAIRPDVCMLDSLADRHSLYKSHQPTADYLHITYAVQTQCVGVTVLELVTIVGGSTLETI